MDIRKLAVEPTSVLHLRDHLDNLLFDKKPDPANEGEMIDDEARPVRVTLHSPGSKAYSRAVAAQQNRMVDKMRKKGKADTTAEQKLEEQATFLAACTIGFENLEYEALTGEAKAKAVYSDPAIGFIAEQVGKHLGDWANFSAIAPKA